MLLRQALRNRYRLLLYSLFRILKFYNPTLKRQDDYSHYKMTGRKKIIRPSESFPRWLSLNLAVGKVTNYTIFMQILRGFITDFIPEKPLNQANERSNDNISSGSTEAARHTIATTSEGVYNARRYSIDMEPSRFDKRCPSAFFRSGR